MPAPIAPVCRTAVMPAVPPAAAYAVVVDFPAYPRLFSEIKVARVLSIEGKRVRAEFRGHIVLPFRYVIDLDCDPEALTVDWRYVEGEVVRNSEGGWRFAAEGNGARVEYRVAMEIAAPVPGFLLRKITDGLVALSLPAMFASVEREALARMGR
ncbi:MAG: SRPBCC family protein [Deltaproteobacteria bacterium]|nr:SRPBCC family protein [Deltaproteobacteria bacterium]